MGSCRFYRAGFFRFFRKAFTHKCFTWMVLECGVVLGERPVRCNICIIQRARSSIQTYLLNQNVLGFGQIQAHMCGEERWMDAEDLEERL